MVPILEMHLLYICIEVGRMCALQYSKWKQTTVLSSCFTKVKALTFGLNHCIHESAKCSHFTCLLE